MSVEQSPDDSSERAQEEKILGKFPRNLAPKDLENEELKDLEIRFERPVEPESGEHSEVELSVEEIIGNPERLVRLKREIDAEKGAESPEPERIHDRKDLYMRFAKPYVLKGIETAPTLLYYGGLSTTGYPWRDFATKMYDRSLRSSEIYTLKGQEGDWESFKNVHWRDWVDDIVERAKNAEKPVFFGYSTGAAAGLIAEAENPGLFSAMVLVGVPLALKNKSHESLLRMGAVMQQIGLKSVLESGSVDIGDGERSRKTRQLYRSPSFMKVPLPTLLNFWRVSRHARKALPNIECPILVIQGGEDVLIAPEVPDYLSKRAVKSDVTVRRFERSEHGVMMDIERGKMMHEVSEWLNSLELKDSESNEKLEFYPGRVKPALISDFIALSALNERGRSSEEPSEQKSAGTKIWGPGSVPASSELSELGELFAEAYGESYFQRSFDGVSKLRAEISSGKRYIVYIKDENDSVIAQGAIQILPDRSAKMGRLVVKKTAQGQNLGKQIQAKAFELMHELYAAGIIDTAYCQLVTSHPITQKNLEKTPFRPSGIFDRKFTDLFDEGHRESVIRVEFLLNEDIKADRDVFLPSSLHKPAERIFKWLGCKRTVASGALAEDSDEQSDRSVIIETSELQAFGAASLKVGPGRAPIKVLEDLREVMTENDPRPDYLSVKININTPQSHEQIIALQLAGFYFAAIEPRAEADYLVLQKPTALRFPHIDDVVDKKAEELLNLLQ